MKTFNPDDPRWTAYVLNELETSELEQVEREFDENPDLKAFVEELYETAAALTESFAKELPAVGLDDLQRERIQSEIRQHAERSPRNSRAVWSIGIAAAASICLLSGWFAYFQPRPPLESADDLAWVEVTVEAEGDMAPDAPPPEEYMDVEEDLSVILSDIPSPVVMHGLMAGRTSMARGSSMARYSDGPVLPPVISPSLDDFDVLPPSDFRRVLDHPLSTFSVDVDTASYTVVRRMLREGRLPPPDAVRVEEMINFFQYDYAAPVDGRPFAAHLSWSDFAQSTWGSMLVRIAIKGREIPREERPGLNLVYLIDTSGSMHSANRLPLVKRALEALVRQLDERDHVSIVVYASQSGLVLPPTSGAEPERILEKIEALGAGGSTAGGAGIQLAYQTARQHFDPERVNRVILCTDGDFNVGMTSRGELERLIEEEAKSGVFLSVLGFGMGNYKDSTLEILSNKGNGNYAYIDDFAEARRVLVDQMLGTLVTIAKDVKLQVEFNPARVAAYRLVGYENRMLRKEDFNNDKVDAGEIGAGHTVTALYEIIPVGQPIPGQEVPPVDALRYQSLAPELRESREILNVKIRYKEPDGEESKLLEFPLSLDRVAPDDDFRFAAAVAAFGKALRDPAFAERVPMEKALELAEGARGRDPGGYRAEFVQLIRNAMALRGRE